MKILVFGNMLVEADSLPLRLMPKLEKLLPSVEFKEFDTAENLEDEGRDLIILDTAFGIEKVNVDRGCRHAPDEQDRIHA